MNYTLRNLLVAALLMLMGILAVVSFIRSERQQLSRGKQEVKVFVAAKDIPAGTPASKLESGGYLETTDMLREDAPPNAVGKLSSIKNLVSNVPVHEGEVVSVTAFDKTAGLAPPNQIKGNERLFTVPIAASNDAAGLIRAGDHVDMFAALPTQAGGMMEATVVARDVEVIETPETLTPDGVEVEAAAPEANGDTKLYVFKTTDEEALNIKFALANSSGNVQNGLSLMLRPASGDTESKLNPILKADPTVR